MKKNVIITGINGQDGSYLADLLLKKNYKIYGIVRSSKSLNKFISYNKDYKKINFIIDKIKNCSLLENYLDKIKPSEFYHLSSPVTGALDLKNFKSIYNDIMIPGINIIHSIATVSPNSKLFLPGSSLMYGSNKIAKCNEKSFFSAETPYGIAKTSLFNYANIYKQKFNLHISNGILFNHESPRRNKKFVGRKITSEVAKIYFGKKKTISLGNLNVKKDWLDAKDVANAIWKIMQCNKPDNFVIGSGKLYSLELFVKYSFEYVGLNWKEHVIIDNRFKRNNEPNFFYANIRKAKKDLNWEPKINFKKMIYRMIDNDLRIEEND